MENLPFAEVNLLAVLASAVLLMVLGSIWYAPGVFGNRWMKLANLDMKNMSGATASMIWGFIVMLFGTYFLAVLVALLAPADLATALTYAVLIWLAIEVPIYLGAVLWEKKSMNLFWITSLYGLLAVLLVVTVLTQWPW